jgi:predicted AlkP superfamily phosphohydrolase/phosphomutase
VLSDHGFADLNYHVHLNRWLVNHGYLQASPETESGNLKNVDWPKSQAYAVGLNSLYLNLAGREGQGAVLPDQQQPLLHNLRHDLLSWRESDGGPVFQQIWLREEVFSGPFAGHGPDMILGYAPGYRASADTGLGKWGRASLEHNHDHWGADHCMAPQAVPGVLFANQSLRDVPNPSFRDIPALAIGQQPSQGPAAPPPPFSDEDREIIAERLQGLGYL